MTGLDWIIVVVALALAAYGSARGFIVGALSLAGFLAGAVIGTRLGPGLLSQGSASPYAPAFGLVGALLAGVILSSGLEGLGLRVRSAVRIPVVSAVDAVLGALLSACVVLGVAWVSGAVVLQAPGTSSLRADVQRSVILRKLNELLPPSGALLHALARLDPIPTIQGPAPDLRPPQAAIARGAAVRAAERSVVRVLGTACGLGVEGSGWIAAPGLVVTNAHVVAGESDTVVQLDGRPPGISARAIALDPTNDVAVLRVRALGRPPLALASGSEEGRPAAIMGFPHDGPFVVTPARVGATRAVLAQDAYGQGPVNRLVTPFRGRVRSGNSGGPVVDAGGHVATMVFAATVGSGPSSGYGVADDAIRRALASASGPVSTGPCAH